MTAASVVVNTDRVIAPLCAYCTKTASTSSGVHNMSSCCTTHSRNAQTVTRYRCHVASRTRHRSKKGKPSECGSGAGRAATWRRINGRPGPRPGQTLLPAHPRGATNASARGELDPCATCGGRAHPPGTMQWAPSGETDALPILKRKPQVCGPCNIKQRMTTVPCACTRVPLSYR